MNSMCIPIVYRLPNLKSTIFLIIFHSYSIQLNIR
nr:MAG TPA_asm: hypothetical protein [Caudoviricetes sp.]